MQEIEKEKNADRLIERCTDTRYTLFWSLNFMHQQTEQWYKAL